MPEIVVSATRIESTLATSPDSITVVTREEIENIQARTVADVLETVPGVIVSRTGQPGGQTSVFMRGANSGQTLVLVDGVRVNSAFNGRFDFVDMTVDNVERIEVVRGPQSTRYGSDALGGVINIVTQEERRGQRRLGARRGAAATTASRTRASLAAALGGLSFSAEGGTFDTDNERAERAVPQRRRLLRRDLAARAARSTSALTGSLPRVAGRDAERHASRTTRTT